MKLGSGAERALLDLLAALDRVGYDFVAPTPATHARVIARPDMRVARDLRGIFGWSLPFAPETMPEALRPLLDVSELFEEADGLLHSRVRVSRLGGRLFVHSAYPTDDKDAVFFGPDSYRFVDFIRAELARAPGARRLVDIGSGSGVGGIMAAAAVPGARITLLDVNAAALRFASVNARYAGVDAELVEGDSLGAVSGLIDLVVANPPYIVDEEERDYRDGGDMRGARVSLDWTLEAAARLEPAARMLLYTGVAIVEGRDALREALEKELPGLGCSLRYRELDPDIFGEELDKPGYRQVERIAAVGAVVEAARKQRAAP
jgi:methylase of polypeptide subunit release factors